MFIIGCATRHKAERRNKVFAGKLTNGLKQDSQTCNGCIGPGEIDFSFNNHFNVFTIKQMNKTSICRKKQMFRNPEQILI
jgi:hypothetical protein